MIEHQPAGARRNTGGQLFRRQFVALLQMTFNQNRCATVKTHAVRKCRPVRNRHNHFVAIIERSGKGIENDLLGTVGNHNVGNSEWQPVFPLQFLSHRLTQRWNARRRRVFGFTTRNRLVCRLFNVSGRIKIRLTGGEIQNIHPSFFQVIGALFRRCIGGK